MKKILLACCILIASCYFGEIEAVPEATKLSLQNNSSVQLFDVVWNGAELGNIDLGRILTKEVPNGHGFVYFNANGKPYRTQSLVVCTKYKHERFQFTDGMSIIDISTSNMITIGSLLNEN
ncbi:MAG: hypothetical protein FWB90_01660 [Fibromonadales bacterium]|nr:hypothetical protein [Fibromonadales bacterium]